MILGFEGLADYHSGLHSLEGAVSSGSSSSQLDHSSTCSFAAAAHVSSESRRGCRAEDWCDSETQSSEVTGVFSENAGVKSAGCEEEASGDSSGSWLDSEGIALYVDLPCSPWKDSSGEFGDGKSPEQLLAVGSAAAEEGAVGLPALPICSHEQPKMTSQAEVSQRSEPKLSSNLSAHVLRTFLETDNVPRFKRWRQVTAIDQSPESAPYMMPKNSEILPSLKMSAVAAAAAAAPVKEAVNVPSGRDGNAVLAGVESGCTGGHRKCSQGECLTLEKTECKTPLNLGAHALRALMETDDVQKLKRRRLTTPAESAVVKDCKDLTDRSSPDFVRRQSSELLLPKEIECPEETLPSPDSDAGLVSRSSAQSDIAHDAMDITGSGGDCTSEIDSSGVAKDKSDSQSDSSSGSQGNSPLDKYISRPARSSGGSSDAFGSKKKEWLGGQHHDSGGGKAETGAGQDVGFAGNVGRFYRSAIDKRPAAPHPGFVGDGATVQFCRICGEREDATSSLICDSCEEVFHMACVNARMKIVPRVDEWLCRPCKKKRKMSRECDIQGDSDPGAEPKDWWREDSGIGRVERELLRMSNGRRMKVRLGPKFQAEVPEWTGSVGNGDVNDNLAVSSYRFGYEVPLTTEEKLLEKETAEYNLKNSIWPRGWLPATQLPPGSKENWIRCTLVLFDQGDICPDGQMAEKDIICGKWRRAPLGIVADDQWECSCALVWDPRHADCAVAQELSTEEITQRMKNTKPTTQQEPIYI